MSTRMRIRIGESDSVPIRLAVIAIAAWNTWLDGHTITHCEVGYIRTNFGDYSCAFMADDHGCFKDEIATSAVLPVMDV